MAEYIERKALLKMVKANAPYIYYVLAPIMLITPNAADVVEVVRCKDCKYFSKDSGGRKYCDMLYATMLDTDYCAYGKRKDGAGDD